MPSRLGRALHRGQASFRRCKTVVRRVSCDLQRAAGIRVARSQEPLRWLSLGSWKNTRACSVRAPCRLGCDPPARRKGALHRREAFFLLCKTVVPNASCDLHHAAGLCVTDARAQLRWLCLGKWHNTRACRARAPCRPAATCLRDLEECCTGERPLCFRARPWCDVRAVTSIALPAFAWHGCKGHCSGCLSGGGRTRKLAMRARRAALVVVCLHDPKGHCTGGRPFPLGVRHCCNMRAVTSNRQPAFAWPTHEPHCVGCVSGGDRPRKLAARERRVALAAAGPGASERYCTGGRHLIFGARPWCDVRALTSSSAASIRVARAQAPLRWLSLGRWRNTRAFRAQTPCRAECDRSACPEIELHRRKGSLLRCKMVVRRASCVLQRTTGIHMARTQAPLRWLSLVRWRKHEIVACTLRRAGCSRSTPYARTQHTREASLLRCKTVVRRASCDLQQRSRHSRGTRTSATAVAVSRKMAKNTSFSRARHAALVAVGIRSMQKHCTGDRPLSYGTRPWCDVRAVTSNAQPAFAWHARKRQGAGCLSEDGENTSLSRARSAALDAVGIRSMQGHCTSERPLSYGARLGCDVRAVTSNAQPAFAWHARKRQGAGCLSEDGEKHELVARTPCRSGCCRYTLYARTLHK